MCCSSISAIFSSVEERALDCPLHLNLLLIQGHLQGLRLQSQEVQKAHYELVVIICEMSVESLDFHNICHCACGNHARSHVPG